LFSLSSLSFLNCLYLFTCFSLTALRFSLTFLSFISRLFLPPPSLFSYLYFFSPFLIVSILPFTFLSLLSHCLALLYHFSFTYNSSFTSPTILSYLYIFFPFSIILIFSLTSLFLPFFHFYLAYFNLLTHFFLISIFSFLS
jgi:hypothetical protein